MRLNKIQKKLISICEIFKLGEIEAYQQEDSSQNRVFKIVTTKGTYIVKEFSKDAIGNYYYLRKRKEQIAISEQLKKHKINCIIPKRINDKQFFLLDKQYYLVYDCSKDKYLTQDNITEEHIIELAKTQAKIHKLNIETKLPCTYKHMVIDFELFAMTIKDPNIKDLIVSNKEKLTDYIKKGNNALPSVKKNLCYSHNDYKHQNILWNNTKMTLIDFDASGLSNPTAALIESAFTYSKQNNEIN
jgi:Ser/Thr protein kinase RdoA (MazF antagonist)